MSLFSTFQKLQEPINPEEGWTLGNLGNDIRYNTSGPSIWQSNTIKEYDERAFNDPVYYVVRFNKPLVNKDYKFLFCIPSPHVKQAICDVSLYYSKEDTYIAIPVNSFFEDYCTEISFEEMESHALVMRSTPMLSHYYTGDVLVIVI